MIANSKTNITVHKTRFLFMNSKDLAVKMCNFCLRWWDLDLRFTTELQYPPYCSTISS